MSTLSELSPEEWADFKNWLAMGKPSPWPPKETCVHCRRPIVIGGNAAGWGVHSEGGQRLLSRCDPADTGEPYGLNGHTADVSCQSPCYGTHVAGEVP